MEYKYLFIAAAIAVVVVGAVAITHVATHKA